LRRLALTALGLAAVGIVAVSVWRAPQNAGPAAPRAAASFIRGDRLIYPAGRTPELTLPDGSKQVVRSLLNVPRTLRYGDWVWREEGVPAGPAWIRVDLARQTLSLFRGGHEIGSAVILYGSDGKPTPTGVFPVLAKAREHRSSLYDAEMPFMLRLTGDGVAVHASEVRFGRATHGCIGVPPDFARLLFDAVRRGDPVAILPA
jgi:hypothetical protein